MSSRTWQMLAAFLSLAVMTAVLVRYGMRDHDAPSATQDPESTARLRSPDGHPPRGSAGEPTGKPQHEGGRVSPIQVFAASKVGDWQAYRVTTESSLAQTFHANGIVRITAVDDKRVSRGFVGRVEETGEVRKDRYEDRPRAGLTLDELTTNDVGGWTIYDVAITDELHEVAGRKFKCKRISFESRDPLFANKRTHTDLWISDEVPADGLVEEIEVQDLGDTHFRIVKQVLGFGDETTTRWGQKPDGL